MCLVPGGAKILLDRMLTHLCRRVGWQPDYTLFPLDAERAVQFAKRIVTGAGGMGLGIERVALTGIGLGEVDQIAVGCQTLVTRASPSISK